MAPPLRQQLRDYYDTGFLLYWSASSFIAVLIDLVLGRRTPTSKPLSISTLRDEAFTRFWLVFSAEREATGPQVGSHALIPPLLAQASGTVLDVGPGSGSQLPLFAKNTNISMIYGAEPCVGLHKELGRRVKTKGLEGRYRILSCGAQEESLVPALAKEGLLGGSGKGKGGAEGVFDTIVCIRVLCSVPNPQETLRGLYAQLKPGGKLIVTEHVKNDWREAGGSIAARSFQVLCHVLGWPFFMGDCHMNRDTKRMLLDAAKRDGGWAEVDLRTSFGWSPLPYLSGVLVRRGS